MNKNFNLSPSYIYADSVIPPAGTTPTREFGLGRLQQNVTIIAADTINDQVMFNKIEQLKDKISNQSTPKLMTIVDVQNDFVTGSLKVEGANRIFAKIEELISSGVYDAIILTADNHPRDHVSFASSHDNTEPFTGSYTVAGNRNLPQTAWPDHCVQGSEGAELDPTLIQIMNDHLDKKVPIFLFPKGEGQSEAYSAGENVAGEKLPYYDFLSFLSSDNEIMVDHVGLAAEYCVAATAKSAAKIAKINSRVIGEATMAVEGSLGMQSGSLLSEKQIEQLYSNSNVTHVSEGMVFGA